MYNPLDNIKNTYFYISNNSDYSDVKKFVTTITNTITTNTKPNLANQIFFYNISFDIKSNHKKENNKNKYYYTITLNDWSSNIDINTLYLFNTHTNELLIDLTNIYELNNQYYIDFEYDFKQTLNYITISDTDDMSGYINEIIDIPIIYKPIIKIEVDLIETNIQNSMKFILKPNRIINYYDSINIYYTDNNKYANLKFIAKVNINIINNINQINFLIPANITTDVYYYISYTDVPRIENTVIYKSNLNNLIKNSI